MTLSALSVLAQSPPAGSLQVGHDFWGFKEGAPEDVSGIAQTSDGFLWLATPTGLFCFDGTRFERFRSPFGDQLLSNNLRSVFAPSSGGLWIGYTFGGFSFLDNNGRLTNYGGEAASSGTVNSFAQDQNGNLWAGATSGLWRFDGSRWMHLGVEWNAPARQTFEIAFDSQGVLWALAGSEPSFDLLYVGPGTGHFQTAVRNLHVFGFTLDANGAVVTGPQGKPPVPNSTSDEQTFGYPITVKDSAALIDRTGSVWVNSVHEPGIRRLPPSDQPFQALSQLAASHSEAYPVSPYTQGDELVDREGNVWFGEAKGLHRFFYSPLVRFKEIRKDAGWYAVVADDDGAVWIASDNQLQHSSHAKIDAFKKLEDGARPNFAFRAPDRTFWFATSREFWHLAGRTWTRVALPPNAADQVTFLQTITQDSQGGMWISFGRHGLFRFANGVWTPYGGREDLPKTGVVIEFTDHQGRVWFGYTKNLLAVLDGDRVQVFGPSDGLRVGNVTAIQGRGAAIWIGGEFGLQQYDQGHFRDIHAVDDELLRGISGIVETADGDLWFNGLSGIFHIAHAEIAEARKDPDYRVKGEHFGRREGLLGTAFQLRPLNTAIEGTDGRLWFTGSSGVVWLDPAQSEKKVSPPPTTILSVSADDKFYPPDGPLKLPAHTSNVQISYAAVSLSDPEAISYRYKLQETDKDWHVVGTANPVSYRNLAPGSYHFNANATDTNGVWSDQVAITEFTILPAFYQTRWFLVLCIGAALTVLYLLYLLRLRQVAQQFRVRMEERVNERTRIAQDLHDTLLQSFQGVLLRFQSVSNVFTTSPDEAKRRLDSTIEQAAQAITEGRDAVQGLRSCTMQSEDLAAALGTLGEELGTVDSDQALPVFHVEVEGTSRELKPILRDEVYRITGEALRNAFRHAQAHRVEVVVRYDDSQLILHVRDDGKGIGSQILEDQGRVGHWGLQGMRERARKIGGKLEVWSRPESGTEVELQIPAAKAYASRRSGTKGLSFGLFVSLFLYSFFLSQSLLAQAQQAANLQVGHDFWGFKEGAPEDVSRIAQTSDGFLWLATPTGLFRFDGTRFERFRSPFGDQLLSNNLRSVFAPPSGGLWIGYTFGGFSFLDNNGRLTNYGGEAASTGTVESFAQDRDGNLWAGATSGLWRFDGSQWRRLGVEWNAPAGRVTEVAFDSHGVLWALAGTEPSLDLLYLRPGTGQFQTAERNLRIYGFALDPNGAVVTGAQSKPPVPNSTSDERTSGYPITWKDSAALIDRTGSIWVNGYEPAIRRLPPSDQPNQALKQPVASNSEVYPVSPYDYHDSLVDREGNVWFGEAKGLHRFFYSPLVRLEEVRKDAGWYAVAADDNGAVWIASGNQLQLFSRGKSGAPKKLGASRPNFAFRAPDRTFWFATDRELWHLAGRTWTRVALPPNMTDQVTFLQTITQDSQGGMWISFGRHGLFRLANGLWTPYGSHEDLPKTGVVIEFTDQRGRVWFGYTKNTLAVLDGDRVQVFGPSEGLRVGNITAIQGRGTAIWIGGEFGLQQYDQGHFHEVHAVDDELLRGISGIVETTNGDLWLNGLAGIFHVPHTEISEARKDPNYRVKGEHFGRREGLLGLAFQLRPLNTAVEGTDGRIWFTGSSGVVSVDPAQSEKKVPAPPTTILSVSADDKFYPPGGPLKLPAHTSNVQISFAAVSLSDPEAVSYRYKLKETDKDWHVVPTASPVSYRNLSPGLYHFSVNASDTNGVWSDKIATAEFSILPAFYQTPWFLVLCIAAALTVLSLLYLLRLQQVALQFRMRMDERVNERTRIARELHDTLLQSFQGLLLRLQTVSDRLPVGDNKENLDSAIEQGAQAIAEGRDAVQGLRSSTVLTNDLAAALSSLGEELAASGSSSAPPTFRVEVEGTPRELHPILRDEVFRIAAEALRNAFRHAQAHRVEIAIRYDEQRLTLRVRDDGKGIGPDALKETRRSGHWGLQGMRERARRIGAQLELWSRPEAGTEVQLRILGANAYQSWRARARWFWFRRSTSIDS